MKNSQIDQDEQLAQQLESLKKDYTKLNEDKIKTSQRLETLEAQLKELKAKAQEEYGTSDVSELETMLAQKRKENQKLVEDYREHISSIQDSLSQLEDNSEQP